MYLPNGLTEKELKFIKAYLGEYGKDYYANGTQSVLLAYNTKDENTAGVMAYELLRNPKIVEYVNEYKRVKAESINENDIVNELIEIREYAKKEGKYSDALKANELLGKWKAMFTDKNIVQNETFEDFVVKMRNESNVSQSETVNKSINNPVYKNDLSGNSDDQEETNKSELVEAGTKKRIIPNETAQ